MAARCSSTSSARCRGRAGAAAARGRIWRGHADRLVAARSRSMSASSPRPTSICPRWSSEGRFRADLLDRLSFEVVTLPPLRAPRGRRPGARRPFRPAHGGGAEWGAGPASRRARWSADRAIDWPGNVRELRNVVERAVYRWDDPGASDRRHRVRSVRFALEAKGDAARSLTPAAPPPQPAPARRRQRRTRVQRLQGRLRCARAEIAKPRCAAAVSTSA